MSQIQPPVVPPAGPSREELRIVAGRQKGILVCIFIYLISVVLSFFVPAAMRPVLAMVVLAIGVGAAVFVFMLATRIYGTGVGIALGILTLMPFIGLIVLFVVDRKATGILKKNGVKVGLLGAWLSKI